VDDNKKYTASSIPPRDARPAQGIGSPAKPGPSSAPLFTNTEFAEIEYESAIHKSTPGETQRCGTTSAPQAQSIGPRTIDPIRETFYSMRSLASGTPLARNDAGLFYKQAKFMEDFSDEFYGFAKFSMYYPYYQHMGYEQLRTYFTWRTNVRRGNIYPTSLSYVFLYMYELLSNIGVNSPADGLDKLMTIWRACRDNEPSLDQYLPPWLKDYHIYYELPYPFADFVNEHHLQNHYPPELFLFEPGTENALTAWNNLSSYDVTKSKFYAAGNESLLKDCFSAVLRSIHKLCTNHNIRVEDLFIYGVSKGTPWYPFQRALFMHGLGQPDRQVNMPGREFYSYNDNRWFANIPIYYSDRKELAGYIIKKTEACLRRAVGYRFKITADPGAASQSFQPLKSLGIPPATLSGVIEKTVADFHRDSTRTVVVVDHDTLARIRKESLGTQDKLIVPEDDAPHTLAAAPGECNMPAFPQPQTESHGPVPDVWAALKDALNAAERDALSLALRGDTNIKAFADKHGVMLEVLADNINEKAADIIGDNIVTLDETITIYDDYRENVAEIVG